MSPFDLLSFGIGGAAGAALAVAVGGARLSASWQLLNATFLSYRANKSNEEWAALEEAFEGHAASVRSFSESIAKLKRALRIK